MTTVGVKGLSSLKYIHDSHFTCTGCDYKNVKTENRDLSEMQEHRSELAYLNKISGVV